MAREDSRTALETREHAHLAASVRAALTASWQREALRDGGAILEAHPWLEQVPVSILLREGVRAAFPDQDLRLSVHWQARLERSGILLERRLGRRGARRLVLDAALGELVSLLDRGNTHPPAPARSLGMFARQVHVAWRIVRRGAGIEQVYAAAAHRRSRRAERSHIKASMRRQKEGRKRVKTPEEQLTPPTREHRDAPRGIADVLGGMLGGQA